MRFRDQPRTSPWVWATPLVGIILFIVAMGAFLYTLHTEDQSQAKLRTVGDVELARQTIRTKLLQTSDLLSKIANSYGENDESLAVIRPQIDQLLRDLPEISDVTLVNQERVALSSIQQDNRRAASIHPVGTTIEDAESYWAFTASKDSRFPVYSRPFLGPANRVFIELHAPIFRDNRFIGTLIATFPIDDLLLGSTPDSFKKVYLVSIIDGGGNLIASNASRSIENAKLSHEVPLEPPGHGLKLRAVLYRSSSELFGNMLAWTVLGLSFLIVWSFILLFRHAKMRSKAEHQLLAETKFRRAMEDSVITGMRAIDLQGRITYVNPAFCKMTGFTENELVGMLPPFPYWPENSYREQEDTLQMILAGKAPPKGVEVSVRRRDGSIFDSRMYVSPLIDSDGQQSGWMTSMTDITEPRRVREELAAAHRRFVRILEELDAAVAVDQLVSEEGKPIFTNRIHREWFGEKAPPPPSSAESKLGKYDPFEWRHPNSHKWYEVRRRPISWVDGKVVIMQIATDISMRREAQEMTRQQEEKLQFTSRLITLGELASSLAHEVNQPLTAIANYNMGCVSRIKSGSVSAQELLPVLEKVNGQAQRAGDVIRRIREFVKQQEPNRIPSKLSIIVQDAVGLSQLESKNHATDIQVVGLDQDLEVLADQILIEQVLMNLIKNGLEAMASIPNEEKALIVKITTRSQMACVSVTDRGTGVPENIREKLFESFFTTKSNGMGMGLNICRTIIEYHQGQLWVEPAEPTGSVFSFTLPLVGKSSSTRYNNETSKEAS